MWLGTRIPWFQAFPSPRQSGGSKGCLRRLHFMRPFAPCFGKFVASAQVYLVNHRDDYRRSTNRSWPWIEISPALKPFSGAAPFQCLLRFVSGRPGRTFKQKRMIQLLLPKHRSRAGMRMSENSANRCRSQLLKRDMLTLLKHRIHGMFLSVRGAKPDLYRQPQKP